MDGNSGLLEMIIKAADDAVNALSRMLAILRTIRRRLEQQEELD